MRRKVVSYETDIHNPTYLRITLECGHVLQTDQKLSNCRRDTREGRALIKGITNRASILDCETCDQIVGKTPVQLRNEADDFQKYGYQIPNVPGWHWVKTKALYFKSPSDSERTEHQRLKQREATARYLQRHQPRLPPGREN
jgi:hypothetical protein